ncbi:MAG: hypothetical protein QNJ30_17910 [Kiloniellales bacterium]|nr:hypothetical protein [Kiloniellales bacterium]
MRSFAAAYAAALISIVPAANALADVIIENGLIFREFRVNPPLNFTQGPDLLVLRADVRDSDTGQRPAGAIASVRNLETGESFTMLRGGSVRFFRLVPYKTDRAEGTWVVEVSSDVGSAAALLPRFGIGPGTGSIPGVSGLTATSGSQPTLTWTLPADLPLLNDGNIDRIRLRLNDSNSVRILDEAVDDSSLTTTSATVAPGVITHNGAFVSEVLIEGFAPYDRSIAYETFVVEEDLTGGVGVDGNAFLLQDNREENSVRFQAGQRLSVSANLFPSDNTFAYAENDGVIIPLSQVREADRSFEFAASVAVQPSLTDPWSVVLWNGGERRSLSSNNVGILDFLPFVREVRMIPDFLTPTFEWELPTGNTVPFDAVQIGLFDDVTDERLSVFGSNQDELFATLPAGTISYKFDPGQLEEGRKYAVRVLLTDFDSSGFTVNRSLSFFNFTPVLEASNEPLYLPNEDESGRFSFDFDVTATDSFTTAVPANTKPPIAVGYEYAVGEGDPNFASVTLPPEGGESYDVVPFDDAGNSLPTEPLAANERLDFTMEVDPAGVERFVVLGVDEPDGQGQGDATLFETTLSFTQDGQFTGTIIPITVSATTTVQLVEALQNDLDALVDGGELDEEEGKKLTRILDLFLVAFARDRIEKGCRLLDRFVGRVEDLVEDGELSPEDGNPVPLVQQAEAVRSSLGPGACDAGPGGEDDDDDDDDDGDGDDDD